MTTVTTMSKDTGALAAEDRPLIPPHGWAQIGILAALFVALFWDILYRAYGFTFDGGLVGRGYAWTDGNWSHAFVVPLISLYFLYQHRDELKNVRKHASWLGLALMIVGIALYALSMGPRAFNNVMFRGYSMIMTLGGLVWFMGGGGVARIAWFPVFYLVFAIKISDRVWEEIAFHLQGIAAKAATAAIGIFGIVNGLEAQLSGNTITLYHHLEHIGELNVAEACSGLRMLMTFIALGFAVAYLANRPWWIRLTLVSLTIPIAILINAGRVTVLGFIYPYNQEMATGEFHIFVGMLMLIPALLAFMFVGWALDWLFVPDADAKVGRDPKTSKPDADPTSLPPSRKATARDVSWGRFFGAAGLLLVCAVSFQSAIAAIDGYLIKEPIHLRRGLELLPSVVGPYEIHEKQARLSKDMEDVLGTGSYISWVYRDTRKAEGEPGALVRVHVPYYTGTIDTVPHVPDRCFVAGGAQPIARQIESTTINQPRLTQTTDGDLRAMTMAGKLVKLPDDEIPMTVVTFAHPQDKSQTYCVTYFFVANNTYTATPEGVRLKALNLTDKYAYHAKVEVMPFGAKEPQQTVELTREFLSYMLPEIFLCLPDWEAANAAPDALEAETTE